jgi:glycosyltransferase involved in cell wall biosynthesis
LTIAHSYCVDLNRRLAQELAASREWDVTAVGPARFRGDFGWHTLQPHLPEACKVVPVPVHFNPPIHLMIYGRLLAQLLREPWDLVHCWEEPYVAAAAQVAYSTRRDVPIVYATFQNIEKRYPPPFGWVERYTMARAAGIIAFGRTSREVAVQRAPGTTPVRVIFPGVDVAHFSPETGARARVLRKYSWDDSWRVVGFVGRFVPEKGCALLTRALERIEEPWRAIFVGSGPLEADLRDWARRYGGRVRIETEVGHDAVAEYLNAMDLLCAPSQTTHRWREQFGRMVIEALACGVPVIASDSGEIPDVVGDAGVIVGEADEQGWTRAIARLMRDEELRADLARRGRQRAVEHFAWQVIARQHLEFFDEIVDRRAVTQAHGGALEEGRVGATLTRGLE